MEKNCYVRVGISQKTGKKYVAVVVKYAEGKEKLLFARPYDYCELLNMSPAECANLTVGDYPIK